MGLRGSDVSRGIQIRKIYKYTENRERNAMRDGVRSPEGGRKEEKWRQGWNGNRLGGFPGKGKGSRSSGRDSGKAEAAERFPEKRKLRKGFRKGGRDSGMTEVSPYITPPLRSGDLDGRGAQW